MLFSYAWYAIHGWNTKVCGYVVYIHAQQRERQTERESKRDRNGDSEKRDRER